MSRTRSGRTIKKPDRWEPDEEVMDDFGEDEYDSDDDSDVSSILSISEDEDDEDDNLDGFIVDDTEEDIEYCDEEEEDDDDEEYCESEEDE